MKAFRLCAIVMAGLATAAVAGPPGPLDGQNIPSNFTAGNLVATQNNWTGFGDYQVTVGGLLPGSEVDAFYLAKTGTKLFVGITGNLDIQGNAYAICIGIPGRTGHTENRTEGVGGPPATFQNSGREVVINTNGTPGDNLDDTWAYGATGAILPCDTDFVVAIDVFNNTMSISDYELFDPTGPAQGTVDPTPGNAGDPLQELFAVRAFVAQSPTDDGNEILENDQGVGYDLGGFDNSNVAGVTATDGSSAATATTGLELGIPFARIGGLGGSETIQIYVLMLDGGDGSVVPNGTHYNQHLPPLGAGAPCDPPGDLGQRPDLSAVMSCITVNLSSLSLYTGTAEGDLSNPASEGYTLMSTQTCPTAASDQAADPDVITRGGGSEMDALYVTDDGVNLYLGITGNLEENGNKFNIWFDTVGTDGLGEVLWDNMGPDGMEGDFMPPFAADPTGLRPNYDYTLSINVGGVAGAREVFADWWDLAAQTSTFKGRSIMESGNGDLSNGANQWNLRVALNNLNSVGVMGCDIPGDISGCDFDTGATVETAAATATSGFEICVPLADLGIDPCQPQTITFWAHLVGGGGWRSNQSLPPMHVGFCPQVANGANLVTDWYNPNAPCGTIQDYYRSVAVTYTTTPSVQNDCNTNGIEDTCEILGGLADCNSNGTPDSCDIANQTSGDCNNNGIPDECEADCNTNGIADECDIGTISTDCNNNGIPDECEADCNTNGIADECDIGTISNDCNLNGIPDECEADCNTNGIADECDIAGASNDCNTNTIPDECEPDCNGNLIADECDIRDLTSPDLNTNGIPDECEGDCTIVGARSCNDHTAQSGQVNRLCLDMVTTSNVEPREGGINDLEIDLDQNSRTVSVTSVVCSTSGDVTASLQTATPVIDGTADLSYGGPLTVQNVQTSFGNAVQGTVDFAVGSELDAGYGRATGGVLYLTLTGNLESNFNKLEIFIDSVPGGQNRLLSNNPVGAVDRLSDDGSGNGLTFDAGFEADFYISPTGGDVGTNGYQLFADYATLPTAGAGVGRFLGQGTAVSDGTLVGGDNPDGILITINNSNVAGVGGGVASDSGAGVTTGVELAIPFAAIGNPTGSIKVCAFINGAGHDFLANQVLASADGTGAGGLNHLGEPRAVDFSALAGDQFFTVGGTQMNLRFDPPLPDEETCVITLDCNASLCVRTLPGDTNRNGTVTTGDFSAVRFWFNQSASVAGAENDFNMENGVTTGDASAVRFFFNNTVPACP